MATTLSYYDELKTKYDADAAAKKAALDATMARASTAQFDESGKLIGYGDKGPGTLDVQQMEGERRLAGMAEGAGMLQSGQYARDLATSQAQYRGQIIGMREQTAADKAAIESEQATNIAEAKAKYGEDTAGGGSSTNGSTSQPKSGKGTPSGSTAITPPPVYSPANTARTVRSSAPVRTPVGVTSNLPAGFRPRGYGATSALPSTRTTSVTRRATPTPAPTTPKKMR